MVTDTDNAALASLKGSSLLQFSLVADPDKGERATDGILAQVLQQWLVRKTPIKNVFLTIKLRRWNIYPVTVAFASRAKDGSSVWIKSRKLRRPSSSGFIPKPFSPNNFWNPKTSNPICRGRILGLGFCPRCCTKCPKIRPFISSLKPPAMIFLGSTKCEVCWAVLDI